MSIRLTCPASTAAVHNPKIVANRWRIPRRRRGSSIAAKHSTTLPPLTCPSTAARSINTATAASAADPTGPVLPDCTCNGAADPTKDPREVPVLTWLRCSYPPDTPAPTQL